MPFSSLITSRSSLFITFWTQRLWRVWRSLTYLPAVALLCGSVTHAQDLDNAQSKVIGQHQMLVTNLSQKNSTHPGLGEALSGLGRAYLKAGLAKEAAVAFERSLQITKVNFGLYNPLQLPVIEQLSNIYFALEDWPAADQQQTYAYLIRLRTQTSSNADYLSATYKRAHWYIKTKRPVLARNAYAQAIQVIEQKEGRNSSLLIQPLLEIANTYRLEYNDFASKLQSVTPNLRGRLGSADYTLAGGPALSLAPPTGIRILKKALAIALQYPKQNDEAAIADIHTAIGDWYMLLDRPQKATQVYQNAIALLSKNPAYRQRFIQVFSQPKLLRFPDPKPKAASLLAKSSKRPTEISIEFSYSISQNGKVQQLFVAEAKPANAFQFKPSEIRYFTRYRPAFKDGQSNSSSIRHFYKHNYETGVTHTSYVTDQKK